MRLSQLIMVCVMLGLCNAGSDVRGDDKKEAKDAPKEETVSDYKSTTHGALQVKAVSDQTGNWFNVYKNDKQLTPPGDKLLNNTVELPPGDYMVRVNKSQRKVTIQAGKQLTLLTGELVVEAKKGTSGWYTPYQGKDAMLTSSPPLLNTPIALFAAKYTVEYTKNGITPAQDMGVAEVKAGEKTVLKR